MYRAILDAAPSPVSRAYRLMVDCADREQAYGHIALFSEPLIKWYGTLGLVQLRQQNTSVLRETGILSQFLSPSLGTWMQIVRLAGAQSDAARPALGEMFAELNARSSRAIEQCSRRIEAYLERPIQKRTLLDFFDNLVAYRNKTRGHGAPSIAHQREFSQVLLEAYDELLERLDMLRRLKLVFVERAEILRDGALHVLRVCNGLNSFILPERLTLPTRQALASHSVHLFTDEYRPLVELSPILVRPPSSEGFYFLNGNQKHVEYLCYDGTGQEYYRPDGYREAVNAFLAVEQGAMADADNFIYEKAPERREADNDFSFGDLGM